MSKTGILTYHYSNNFGGVLQSYALFKTMKSLGIDVEIVNYIPESVNLESKYYGTGLRKNILKINAKDILPLTTLFERIRVKKEYSKLVVKKFDDFREENMSLSSRVNESTISSIANSYSTIIVGSDQVWSPGERSRKPYFLNVDYYNGKKVSYAADSTTEFVEERHEKLLSEALNDFNHISVRNTHSFNFVKQLTSKEVPIVTDPTLLWDFANDPAFNIDRVIKEDYILVYVLGKEISGGNKELIKQIKLVHGDLKVISIQIPTRKFEISDCSDEIRYDFGPVEWVDLIKNATFILTDSFHGTLFSIKFKKPFLAYYTEALRSTRFIDLATRYKIDDHIIKNISELKEKNSLNIIPDFDNITQLIENQKVISMDYLKSTFF